MLSALFDFYGTLVELDVDAPRIWMLLSQMGYRCTADLEAIWNSDGFNGMETPSLTDTPDYISWRYRNISQLALQCGVPTDRLDEIVPYILSTERAFTLKAKEGACKLLADLSALGIPMGVCSNWDDDIESFIAQSGLPTLDAIITSAKVGARKPHPKPFLVACAALGSHPEETLFIGDSWNIDVAGALRAGLIPIWLYSKDISSPSSSVLTISGLKDVMSIVEQRLERRR